MVEGTFGFWAKFAVGLSWTVLIFTFWAIRVCFENTELEKRKIRLLLLVLINIYCFVMGAFLSILAVIGIALAISNLVFWDNVKSSAKSTTSFIYDRIILGINGLRNVRSLGENRFEDKDGNVYKHTGFDKYEKES